QIKSVPGLQSVGATSVAPLNGYAFDFPFFVSGQQAPRQGDMPLAMSYLTDREYLEALRIPLIRGRFFDERDTVGSPAVTVIDATLANEHSPGQDPLGSKITVQAGKDVTFELQVIGVAGHVKQENLYTDSGAGVHNQLYTSLNQLPDYLMTLAGRNMNRLVRT